MVLARFLAEKTLVSGNPSLSVFKGMDRIAHRSACAAQVTGNFFGTLLSAGGQQDLTPTQTVTTHDLTLHDPEQWYEIRAQIAFRQEGRRKHYRFCKDPAAYLFQLEEQLLREGLRS